MQYLRIRGARTHNLKNIDLDLPRDRLIVFTGLSGSGKSSLAFDTLYAEGQRRYVESLSAYARQFLSMMDKPDVDSIEGLSPAIAIEQKTASHNPRSTVGTVTEIYDYLRLLFARVGTPRCPEHHVDLTAQTISQMVDQILELPTQLPIALLAPVVTARKGEQQALLQDLVSQGFVRARIDGEMLELNTLPRLNAKRKHTIEVVVDRLRIKADSGTRLAESLATTLRLSGGTARLAFLEGATQPDVVFSSNHACPVCGFSVPELTPKMFSFNNPQGACATCTGLGTEEFFDPVRIVKPELSLTNGALRGWDRHDDHYLEILKSLARHYRFNIDQPWQLLPDEIQQMLLYGSGAEIIEFVHNASNNRKLSQRQAFAGVIPNLEYRFEHSKSLALRMELSKYRSTRPCRTCLGSRLQATARTVFIKDHTISKVTSLTVETASRFFENLQLSGWRGTVAEKILHDTRQRLQFLQNVGLNYLTLDRSAETLSGGEAQRIRLASQVGAGLTGVLYILDEPSIGLHQRDNERLLITLRQLRDTGNTVIVVEHDEEAIRSADHVVDLGPGAGVHGGQIVAQGQVSDILKQSDSLTGLYLSGQKKVSSNLTPVARNPDREIVLHGASGNNLQDIDVTIPLGLLTCVTGVSGSGKSTLIMDTLWRHATRQLLGSGAEGSPVQRISGLEQIDKVIDIDQSPIGRTPRSNPATYTGLFTPLRELFAQVPEARARGYDVGRFSFNVKGGRCEACQGDGVIKVELHFLPDVYVPCDVCQGKRYNRETLEIRYRGRSIQEVLEMTCEEALDFFKGIPAVAARLHTLVEVGLGYVQLGQNATTLSGGEAQRVKLARELAKRGTGHTLYILDEPTTGLHFHDIAQLLVVLRRLRDAGNTLVVIEHNLDVIRAADWIIDLGPEGGTGGGKVVAMGTPGHIATIAESFTGQYLAKLSRQS
jgi:excinuclease ABC subunit A